MKTLKTLFALVFLLVSAQVVLAVTTGEPTVSGASTIIGDVPPILGSQCVDIKNNLYLRSTDSATGGEVSLLQDFLSPKYFNQEPTGYFGNVTLRAAQAFQRDNGILAAGYVGPITRAKIKELSCAGTTQTLSINSISPSVAKVGETVVLGGLNGSGLNAGGDYILFDGHRIETDGTKVLNRVAFVVPEYITNTINCITTPCPVGFSKKVVPGVYTIQVVNNLGSSNIVKLTVTDGTVVPPPNETVKISWVEPSAAKVGASVIIYGYNLFRPETKILFEGMSIRGTQVHSKRLGNFDSALEFVVPENIVTSTCSGNVCTPGLLRKVTPGTYELAVDNKYGRDAVKFEVLGDVVTNKPFLTSLVPSQGIVGTEVIIFGQNLNTGSESVYFGGSSVSSTWLSVDGKGMMRFKVPEYITPCGYEDNTLCRMMAQQVTPGKYDVVVKNKGGISNTLTFTVTATGTSVAPKLNSLTPSYGVTGTEVVIQGEGINISDDTIFFSRSFVPKIYSGSENTLRFKVPTSITSCGVGVVSSCDVPSRDVVPGVYTVQVVNKNGTSNALTFTVTSVAVQAPTLNSISPLSGAVGSRATVYGSNIDTNTEYVLFAGYRFPTDGAKVAGQVSFIVPRELSFPCVQLKPTDPCPAVMVRFVTPGDYAVAVGNANGVSNSINFTVTSSTSQTPVISSVSSSPVTVGATVTLVGERLNTGNAKVVFGSGYITPDPTRSSDAVLVFTVPSSMPRYCPIGTSCAEGMITVTEGSYQLYVVNALGASNTKSITVAGKGSTTPTILSISPSYGSTGSAVTLFGEGLTSSSDFIWFGDLKVTPDRNVKAANTIIFNVPTSLNQCYATSTTYCLDMYHVPTPLGTYNIKVETESGAISNSVKYQLTDNGSVVIK